MFSTPSATPTPKSPTINALKFINQNKHFMAATSEGFVLCDAATGDLKLRSLLPGGAALVDSYKNSNIFFFVGTGTLAEFPSTRLCLWNDITKEVVGSIQFSPEMKIVDLSVQGEWVVVVFQNCIKVFHFAKGFTREKVVAQF